MSGEGGAIALVGLPGEAAGLVRRGLAVAASAAPVLELEPGGVVARLGERADSIDAVVTWGVDGSDGITLAQSVARHDRHLGVLIVAPPESLDSVARAVRFAPFLGEEVSTWSAAELELVGAELLEAAERTRRRRSHSTIVASASARLAAVPERRRSGDVERLLRDAPIGVATLDGAGSVVGCNTEAARLLGVDRDSAPGRPLEALVPQSDRARVRRLVATADQPATDPVVLDLSADGRRRYVQLSVTRHLGADDEPLAVAIVADVTERERAAARLRHLQAVTDAALAHLDLDALLAELMTRIRTALGVDTVAVLLPDELDSEHALRIRASYGLDPKLRDVRIPLGQGFAGRIARERRAIRITQVEERHVVSPILGSAVASLLGVPLVAGRELIGVLHVGSVHRREFDDDDEALLQLVGDRVAIAIKQARLYAQEQETAAVLQRSLLPQQLPRLPGLGLAAIYRPGGPAVEVGGDWYDVIELGGGEVGLSIGDVVGRGLEAATVMGQLRAALRAYAAEGHGPGAALGHLNNMVLHAGGRLATAVQAVWEPRTAQVHLAVAGHPPPLLVAPDGAARLVEEARGPALGVVPFVSYDVTTVSLEPGARLLLYTDGLVERRGEPLDDSLARLVDAACGAPGGAQVLAERLVDRLLDGSDADDTALLVVESLPLGSRLQLDLPATPDALAAARSHLRRWMAGRDAPDDVIDDMVIACGEACANVVEHAYGPGTASFRLEADQDDRSLVVTVRDFGSWREQRHVGRGRGRALMQALSDDVSVESDDAGTTVRLWRRLQSEPAA